jgi:hypothetical protein
MPAPFFDVPARVEDLKHSSAAAALEKIHAALAKYRGHKAFVRARVLPRSDYLIVNRDQLVEFDEQQHFSEARAVALRVYPKGFVTGFDRSRWLKLCSQHQAKDNDPVYRDEQRAWYDSVRDFLPLLAGMRPTLRLYAADRRWCELSIHSARDLAVFRRLIEVEAEHSASPDSDD